MKSNPDVVSRNRNPGRPRVRTRGSIFEQADDSLTDLLSKRRQLFAAETAVIRNPEGVSAWLLFCE